MDLLDNVDLRVMAVSPDRKNAISLSLMEHGDGTKGLKFTIFAYDMNAPFDGPQQIAQMEPANRFAFWYQANQWGQKILDFYRCAGKWPNFQSDPSTW